LLKPRFSGCQATIWNELWVLLNLLSFHWNIYKALAAKTILAIINSRKINAANKLWFINQKPHKKIEASYPILIFFEKRNSARFWKNNKNQRILNMYKISRQIFENTGNLNSNIFVTNKQLCFGLILILFKNLQSSNDSQA
jgi:hypothetical protein